MLRRADLSCPEVVELLTDWVEGALDATTGARVEAHLDGCDGCTAYLAQLRVTVALLGGLVSPTPSNQLCDELVAAFRGWASG